MKQNNITLLIVCDNHLVVMLSVLLKSIEKTHLGDELIDVYIIDDGISKKNISKINESIHSNKINLIWRTLEEALPKNIQLPTDNTTYPSCTYVRLFVSYFLPPEIKKVIYLDVDMVVMKDIKYLWNTDIGDYAIGAVLDRFEVVSSSWGGIKNWEELGLDPLTKYFNAGLLVINLEKWKEMNARSLVVEIIEKNTEFVTFADQYGLNVAFANNWYEVDPRWNNYALNTNEDPFIIHFTGIKPLFKGYVSNPNYRTIFLDLLKLTSWSNYTPKDNYVWKLKKVKNMIVKNSWDTLMKKIFGLAS